MQQSNTNTALISPKWPVENVLAIQTTRLHPTQSSIHSELNCSKLKESELKLSKVNNHNRNAVASCYEYFNLGYHVGDVKEQVKCNRKTLQEFFPEKTKIQWLDQVHGNQVINVNQQFIKQWEFKSLPCADAIFTHEKNVALAIMTADCLPILLSTIKGDVIAAIHGGWRCLSQNIIKHTLSAMDVLPEEVVAWMGPCIGVTAFEVGHEVKIAFIKQYSGFEEAFIQISFDDLQPKYFADLQKIAGIQLGLLGVNNIYSQAECTYSNTRKYYSYRKEGVTGRMATLICRTK